MHNELPVAGHLHERQFLLRDLDQQIKGRINTMKKKTLAAKGAFALTLALAVAASVTGCSSKSNEPAATTAAAAETEASAIPGPDGSDNTISIGVTPVPHAEIVNAVVKQKLEDAGWKVEVVEFNDYVQPNTALEDGELDANYFQTIRYLQEQNQERGLHLKEVAGIHLEPMGLYANDAKTLDELKDGSSIAIPNDGSNESRAIKLLADNNLITLTETDDLYTLQNIAENPHNYEFVELEAANLPRSLDDVDAAVINGNYALEANLNPQTDALVAELADSDESYKYINYLVVKEGNEETAKTKALIAALENDDVKKYIEETYSGSVIPAF
jgi:D-methionine transport system substrate-binding protein